MKKHLTFSALLLIISLSAISVHGQNEKFKALFMYNFTKYIEWPGDKQTGEFVIAILGNSPLKNELDIIASKKMVGNQPVNVKVFSSINDIGSCHILFIPPEKSASLSSIIDKLKDKGVLIITDKPGLGRKGAGINYVLKGNSQDFEINKSVMKDNQLKVNAALYSLGTVID